MVGRNVALTESERSDSSEVLLGETRTSSHLFAFLLTHSVFRSVS